MDDNRSLAIDALVRFAGCTQERADALIAAWQDVFAEEALGVVAGTERVITTVGDLRVERLRRLVGNLASGAGAGETPPRLAATGAGEIPNPYELGVLYRITPTQARTVIRNWQARYPDEYEERMLRLAASGTSDVGGGTGSAATWIVEYTETNVFEYAVDRLRRYGLVKGLVTDRSNLKLEIPKTTSAPDGADALAILGVAKP